MLPDLIGSQTNLSLHEKQQTIQENIEAPNIRSNLKFTSHGLRMNKAKLTNICFFYKSVKIIEAEQKLLSRPYLDLSN